MTDSDTTQSEESQVEQSQEPTAVDLGKAAGDEAAKQVPSKPKLEDTKLPPEYRAEVAEMLKQHGESSASRAVNEYKQKAEANGELNSKADVQAQIAEALSEEREKNAVATRARASFDAELGKLGIVAGSEKYLQVAKTYDKMETAGEITPKALLSEAGVKALAFAAGAIESETAAGPQRGFDTTYRLEVDASPEGEATTDDKLWAAVNKALGS